MYVCRYVKILPYTRIIKNTSTLKWYGDKTKTINRALSEQLRLAKTWNRGQDLHEEQLKALLGSCDKSDALPQKTLDDCWGKQGKRGVRRKPVKRGQQGRRGVRRRCISCCWRGKDHTGLCGVYLRKGQLSMASLPPNSFAR